MITTLQSLRFIGVSLVVLAFLSGAAAIGLWTVSNHAWNNHITAARHAGKTLFDALAHNADLPTEVTATALPQADLPKAMAGQFERLSNMPRPALVTNFSVSLDPNALSGAQIKFAIVSPDLRYPISELALRDSRAARDTVGEVIALLANYCSPAIVLALAPGKDWTRFEAPSLWHCPANPKDYRLLAVLFACASLAILAGAILNIAQHFSQFAGKLGSQRRLGTAEAFEPTGTTELKEIISAFNAYRENERHHLAERALVLSGVSHDLGTPATRLRLRAALIEDPELRGKFEADIDQMTGIIESVLTYTRAELSTEAPRQMSLRSLVEAVVADYADVGRPVSFGDSQPLVVEGGQSIFMSRRGQSALREDEKVVIKGRPIALHRALSNLIDNALKYGRRAVLRLETDADMAHVFVEDEGGDTSAIDLQTLSAPFERGENAAATQGFGMGLTITSAIALEHGGTLTFERGKSGTVARLSLKRG